MSEYQPFVGPSPFELKDKHIFFGRTKEANELVSLIISHSEVLLYAQSGAGKTSLVNAKVMPMLEEEGVEVLPLARVQGPIQDVETHAIQNIYVFHTLLSWARNEANFDILAKTSLDDYLRRRVHLTDDEGLTKARVAVFDQFEELFTFYPERWRERKEFFNCIRTALIDDPLLRVVFSMREDYIAELDPYMHILPEKLRTRFRLERLRQKAALEAVTKPLQQTERSFAKGAAEELVSDLLEIRTESGNGEIKWKEEFVEPVQLQVVCQNLWQSLPPDVKKITHEYLEESADVDKALSAFYEKSIRKAVEEKADVKEAALRRWFEEVLITPAGTRGTVFRGQNDAGGMPIEVVNLLENEHLIRTEIRGRASWCELTHDRFIQPIRESNSIWFIRSGSEQIRRDFQKKAVEWIGRGRGASGLLDEAALLVAERWLASPEATESGVPEEMRALVQASRAAVDEAAHEYKLKQAQDLLAEKQRGLEVEKRRIRQLRLALGGAFALMIVTGITTVFFFQQKAEAQTQRTEAQAQRDRVTQEYDRAERALAEVTHAEEDEARERKKAEDALAETTRAKENEAHARKRAEDALAESTLAKENEARARKRAENALAESTTAKESEARERKKAEDALRDTKRAEADAKKAEAIAQSRELASYATMQLPVDPELSVILAMEAAKLSRTEQAEEVLRSGLSQLSTALTEMRGHGGEVYTAAFSPDGKRLVTASRDKTARVWDASTGQELVQLRHDNAVYSAAFSPDGRRIVTASADNTARVWKTSSGEPGIVLRGHTGPVRSAVFSPDGEHILTTSFDNTARVWDATTGMSIAELRGHYGSVKATFSPDGRYVVTASTDSTARVWETTTGTVVGDLRGHRGPVNNATFSPDGKYIVTASGDKTARVWTANKQTQKWESIAELRGHTGDLYSALFSPDGKLIVTTSTDNTARVWEVSTTRSLVDLIGHTGSVVSAAFSRDSNYILTASADNTARVWDVTSGKPVVDLRGHSAGVNAAMFSPDGELIVTASSDTTARVWEATPKRGLIQLRGHTNEVVSAAFDNHGKLVVTASLDGTARVWDALSGQTKLTLRAERSGLSGAEFSPDGKLIVTSGEEQADATAHVWNVRTGEVVGNFGGNSQKVFATFGPDGKFIVTGSVDEGKARVWRAPKDGPNWENVAVLQSGEGWVARASFSPDGKLIATPGEKDKSVRLWKASGNGTVWQQILTIAGHEKGVVSVAFSPDGKSIVTASEDGTARVWRTSTGQALGVLRGHTGNVYSAKFNPKGDLIVTASQDKTARVWDAGTFNSVAELRGHSGGVWGAAFSPDGQQIVTASEDRTARIYPQVMFAPFDELVNLANKRNLRRLSPAESEKYLHESAPMPK